MKDLFPIPLLMEKINNLDSVREQILNVRNEKSSNRENYTSFYDEHPMEDIEWDEIRNQIIAAGQTFINQVSNSNDPVKIHAWWNVYNEHNHHCWHYHGDSKASGTLYIYADRNSVPIMFKSPIENLVENTRLKLYNRWIQNFTHQPETGDLLIWPSWLVHMVPEQKDVPQNLRVSLSFNII